MICEHCGQVVVTGGRPLLMVHRDTGALQCPDGSGRTVRARLSPDFEPEPEP